MLMAITPRKEVTTLALITCPECGRQNVSDTAIACPECGYAIREHFERIKDEEKQYRKSIKEKNLQEYQQRIEAEEKQRQYRKDIKEKKLQEYQQRIEAEEEQRIIENKRIEAVNKINNDIEENKGYIKLFSVLLAPFLIFSIFSFSIPGLILAAGTFLIWLFIFSIFKSKIDKSKKSLQLFESNIEQFDKMIEKEQFYAEVIKRNEIERKRRIEEGQHPVCPNCGSKNTHRISTARKIVSTEALGLASSTIGKQYKCDDCKHMW